MNPARRSALLVWDGLRVKGVILVSQSTYRILRDLYELLVQVFAIFLASLGAAELVPQARAPVEQARFLEMTGSNC